jgi:hypothetical protein
MDKKTTNSKKRKKLEKKSAKHEQKHFLNTRRHGKHDNARRANLTIINTTTQTTQQ